ncbi:MAG TPA: asparaginase [Candidatus Baltobacteraceae bacterium]|jgi:L-asparaginase II
MLVEVTRGSIVESRHRIQVFAVNSNGETLLQSDCQDDLVVLRSVQKPFIAAAVARLGAIHRFGLHSRDLAIMSGSHMGQQVHVAAVQRLLEKIGLSESDLQCGVHAPRDEAEATRLQRAGEPLSQLHNNCSGKHAGLLALAILLKSDVKKYRELSGPVQHHVLDYCRRVLAFDAPLLVIDGCGLPVMATPLRNIAIGFARLATLDGLSDEDAGPLGLVRDAMLLHPELVRGVGSFDTQAMHAMREALLLKGGAEGVTGVAYPAAGVGVAIKVEDGNLRALPSATVAVLRKLFPSNATLDVLEPFGVVQVHNVAGDIVGQIRAAHT